MRPSQRASFPASLLPISASFLLLGLTLGACADAETDAPPTDEAPAAAEPAAESTAPDAAAEVEAADALLNPNDATRDELLAVAGLDEAAVDALAGARPFATMLEVDQVLASAGLDESAREEAYREIFLPLDLNTASSEEIMLIPGVGERMTHEFEEYRPYEAMAQFQREIGKYVDEDEVARLERYVVIR